MGERESRGIIRIAGRLDGTLRDDWDGDREEMGHTGPFGNYQQGGQDSWDLD